MNKSTKFLLASVSPVALAAGWAVLDSAPAHASRNASALVQQADNTTPALDLRQQHQLDDATLREVESKKTLH